MPWTWTRTPRRILAPFAALALLLPHAARANPAATEPAAATEAFVPTGTLTLQQLTTLAFARSTAVRADLAAAQIAKTDIRQAKLLGNPQLDATWGALPLGTSNPEGVARPWLTIPNYGIGISYQFLIGKRGPGVRRAEALAQAAGYSAQDTARHITMILARAIAALGVAQLRGAGLHEEVADQQDALELTKNRVSAGFGAPLEIDRLEIELERLQQQEAASVADTEAALTACASILRMPCSPFVDVLTVRAFLRSWEDAAVLRAPGAEGAVALLEKRADLRALEAGARASSEELALARARAIPDPTLRVGYIHDPFTAGGGQPHTASLTVSLPIPVFDSGQAAEQAARLRAEAIADQRRLLLAHAETRLVTLTATLRNRIARRDVLDIQLAQKCGLVRGEAARAAIGGNH